MWAWGPLEADFLRYYKIDLQQEGLSNRLSWRKFLILLRGLPSDSAYVQWLSNRKNRSFAEWSDDAVEEGMTRPARKRRKGGK